MEYTKLKYINEYQNESINPSQFPETEFEMYSVPSYDTWHPEYVIGKDIGSSKILVQKNDILLCKINPRINRVWIVSDESDKQNIASSEWIVIRNHSYNPEYLAWYFRSKFFQNYMTSEVTGIGGSLTRAQPKRVGDYPVPVLSREEQDNIVKTLNTLQKVVNAKKEELNKCDYLIKARFVEMFGEPIANPMGWPVKRLKDVSVLITNGNTPKGGSKNYVESGITFLRSQNVWRNRIELDDVAFIDAETHESMKKSSLHHNDILITKTGRINTENSSLGRAALFKGADNSANINGHVYLVRLDGSIVPEFVVTILTGEAYRKYIRKVCVGGIDKRQINVDQVENFPIIIPPYEQQKMFAAFAAQVDKSKAAVQKSLDETQLLFDSLMQKYFG
jgi:type I restriction enzyme S subunit